MSVSLPGVVDSPDQSAPMRGGLLQYALPAPDGWERGGIEVLLNGCAEPRILDRCFVFTEEREEARPVTAHFLPFQVEQDSACSTLSLLDHETIARERLAATTEFAMGRQLALDTLELGTPSLADATHLGTSTDVVAGVGCLEEAAVLAGFGVRYFLHAGPRTAAALRRAKMIDNDRRSPGGAQWIVSSGYAGTDEGRVWATGTVWIGQGAPEVRSGTVHRRNDALAVADRSALVAFDPCINLSIDIPVGDCPTI